MIRDKFGSRWVFSDNTSDHDSFYDRALSSGWFDVVHEDDDCRVFHIRDKKGEPPEEKKNGDDKSAGGDNDNNDNDNSP